jgi:EAL and modified HD-GYP domain-containing signal transduction protein
MQNVYLGRQPILDNNYTLCAYEILYRDNYKKSDIKGDRHASASVITSVLNKFGTRSLLGSHKAIIKIDKKFLTHDIIFSIPPEFFVFSLLEGTEINDRIIQRIKFLHEKKYEFAVNDVILSEKQIQKYRPLLQELSYFKLKLCTDITVDMKKAVVELKSHGIKIIGSKIENDVHYTLAKELGCDWFQGYYFAKPKILKNPKYESSQSNILKLYNLLIQDTNIDEITSEFEKNHEITVQLLQFVNSGYFHFKNKISSIHHVLILVGRIPLSQWLMLMIYSKSISKNNFQSPLILLVKGRTELMNSIIKFVEPKAKSNRLGEAYFVGVLSLIDTIFGRGLEEILNQMHISEDVKNAILNDEGTLGRAYALVRDIEVFNVKAIESFEKRYSLESDTIEKIVVKSIEDVNSFEKHG